MVDGSADNEQRFSEPPERLKKLLEQMERELEASTLKAADIRFPPLFHYTSSDALLRILESKKLWATHWQHMNDRDELLGGERIVQEEIERLRKEQVDAARAFVFKHFGDHHERMSLSQIAPVFIACLSERGDWLSQWRAYGGNGSGYSIGFSGFRLPSENHPKAQLSLGLLQCEYDESKFRREVRQTLTEVAHAVELYLRTYGEDRGDVNPFIRRATSIALRRVAMLVPRYKNKAFDEEREWRLLAAPRRGHERAMIKYRSGPRGVVPYIPLDLCDDDALIQMAELRIGPTQEPTSALKATRMLLEHHGYDPELAKKSEIPYRS